MTSIKQLAKNVQSSLRSGVILFDLTRIVEELIFNSIDAGATKINIGLSVETSYVKVEDDGCGITRDGLVLLGERYATSKLQCLAEMDTATENFGFRGESLSSLSDISLIEITTKAQGRPNGYRKFIKGCKCLYLGIDDTKQEFGTTVVVRDLFYNQPVRRKYMHSSPKKILHSVKKCVLRVALVRPQVSFKVTDIESGSVVLCTHPSPSPLPLVSSGFGIDISCSLCELSFSKGILKLSGFLSGSAVAFPVKVCQYIYINSRFISKGPIHKLLNNMASTSNCLDLGNGASGSPNGKSRAHAYPAYILNLCCPRSSYDLMFEPSKTTVEFKDWVPVLSFVEQAVMHVWKKTPAQGEFRGQEDTISGRDEIWKKNDLILSPIQGEFRGQEDTISGRDEIWKKNDLILSPIQDLSRDSGIAKKKRRIQPNQSIRHLSSPSFSPEIASKGSDLFSHPKRHKRSSGELAKNPKSVKGLETKIGFDHQICYTLQDEIPSPWDVHGLKNVSMASPERDMNFWPSDNEPLSVEEDILSSELTARQISEDVNDDILNSRWRNGFPKVSNKGSTEPSRTSGHFDYSNEVLFSPGSPKSLKKPFLRSCSLGPASRVGASYANHQRFEVESDECRTQIERLDPGNMINVLEVDDGDRCWDLSSKTYFLDKFAISSPSPSILAECRVMTDLDILSSNFIEPHLENELRFTGEEGGLLYNPLKQYRKRGPNDLSTNSEWRSPSPYSLPRTVAMRVEHFSDDYASESNFYLHRTAGSRNFRDGERKDEFRGCGNMQTSFNGKDCPVSTCINTEFDFDDHFSPSKYVGDERIGFSNKLAHENDWLCLDSTVTDNAKSCGVTEMQISSPCFVKDVNSRDELDSRCRGCHHVHNGRSWRSLSAPPFYKGKNKFSTMYSYATATAEIESSSPNLPVTDDQKLSSQSFGVPEHHFKPSPVEDSRFCSRKSMEKMPPCTESMTMIQKSNNLKKSQCHLLHSPDSEDFTSNELVDLRPSGLKWRNGIPQRTERDQSNNLHDQNDILDISSGLLHLAGSSVVPESISRDCLEDVKVLLQLDKKFIPVVAGVNLVVIDQHAADERIRLEELRQKVLSGEGKTIAYLESEQELVLPEMAYQLLQNYAEQVQNWGWICNIHTHGPGSFRKNLNLLHRRTTAVTLLAVPCILGVNLSDKDLFEFLEQLAETDGSSTLPPSVVRVLNFKACRGAIMFGDALLPPECALILEELKRTSLCFQCAHGRPTTVPLVNLPALHKQISNLALYNRVSDEPWHGLHQHRPSLERARQRLGSAGGGQCG